jgi:hypothetical protein
MLTEDFPRDFVQLHKYIMLVVDVMFVNGLPFLVTSPRGLSLVTIEHLPSRLPIPAGILRIPVFSVPVAPFSQESRFLFRRNFLEPPQKSCLYGAYVGSYVGIEKEQSKDLVRTHTLQPAPSHITNDTKG